MSRIDGEPGPAGDCMKALVTNKRDQQFFFNTEYLQKYNAAKSEKKKVQVPGHHYFKKIESIISMCTISGEMFHEYCVDQTVPPTPCPVSDISELPKFHYLPLVDTPCTKENGERREVDDFQPRDRLRALYKEKAIDVEDVLSIQAFCIKYIVEENLVKSYLEHLKHLEMMNERKKNETRGRNLQENSMSYEDFDWQKMVNEGTLEKQRVCVLDKYIEKHHLSAVRNKNKPEKVSAIIHHLLHAVSTSERDEDQDLVIEEIGESSDEKSDSD